MNFSHCTLAQFLLEFITGGIFGGLLEDHFRNQLVASAGDGLDDLRVLGVISEGLSELPDVVGQNLIGDKRVGPNGLYEAFFGNDFALVFRKIGSFFRLILEGTKPMNDGGY